MEHPLKDVGRSTFVDWLQTLKKEPLKQAAVEGETRSAERPAFVQLSAIASGRGSSGVNLDRETLEFGSAVFASKSRQ
jgi:hypothetical protein